MCVALDTDTAVAPALASAITDPPDDADSIISNMRKKHFVEKEGGAGSSIPSASPGVSSATPLAKPAAGSAVKHIPSSAQAARGKPIYGPVPPKGHNTTAQGASAAQVRGIRKKIHVASAVLWRSGPGWC